MKAFWWCMVIAMVVLGCFSVENQLTYFCMAIMFIVGLRNEHLSDNYYDEL